MTKKEMYNLIATLNADNTEIVDFCNHEIELLENRKSTPKKPSAKQINNDSLKNDIRAVLATAERMTIKEIIEALGGDYSSQKISALLRQMSPEHGDGTVYKEMEKKVPYFSLVANEDEG